MSDKHGRKNLIILGSVGTVLSILMFGFSTSLWWAILSRFLSGLLNGNLGISKSLIGEISNSQTQAQSFGLMGVGWAIGSILGASFGGLLARPAVKWPHAFGETIFERFPYLLISLVNAIVVLIAIVANFIFLKEPIRKKEAASVPRVTFRHVMRTVFSTKNILLTVSVYVLAGAVNTFNSETFPLFYTASAAAGGLDFSTTKTGLLMTTFGASVVTCKELFMIIMIIIVVSHL